MSVHTKQILRRPTVRQLSTLPTITSPNSQRSVRRRDFHLLPSPHSHFTMTDWNNKFDDPNFWDDDDGGGGDAGGYGEGHADPGSAGGDVAVGAAGGRKKSGDGGAPPPPSSSFRCPNCNSCNIESLGASGSSVCTDCGIIVEENTIVSSVEFVEGAGGSSSMVGQL